jgi:hypothetical protein
MASVLLRIKFEEERLEIIAKENYMNNPVTIVGTILPPPPPEPL